MTSSSVRIQSEPADQRVSGRRLLGAGLATIAVAVVANLLVLAIVKAVAQPNPAFLPLSAGAVTAFTTLGVGLGAIVFAIIARRSQRPTRTFRIVAVIALVLSILPNLGLMANPSSAPMPGGTASDYGLLILFHIVAGLVAIVLLPRLARTK
jgi:hypothetical protein